MELVCLTNFRRAHGRAIILEYCRALLPGFISLAFPLLSAKSRGEYRHNARRTIFRRRDRGNVVTMVLTCLHRVRPYRRRPSQRLAPLPNASPRHCCQSGVRNNGARLADLVCTSHLSGEKNGGRTSDNVAAPLVPRRAQRSMQRAGGVFAGLFDYCFDGCWCPLRFPDVA
jgi:hypothetical protein